VDDMIVGLDDVQRKLRIRGQARPRERAGFELRLKCQDCGFTRPHAVDVIYYDLGTHDRKARGEDVPYSEFIIPQRIALPPLRRGRPLRADRRDLPGHDG